MAIIALHIPAADKNGLRLALAGLTAMDMALLHAMGLPGVYDAGVVYKPERPDRWDTADIVYQRGYGDCEDLAAWRAAELRLQGVDAHADVYSVGVRRWHAIVVMPDGTVEDPSRLLGMDRYRRRAK